jgi:beta-glucosidase
MFASQAEQFSLEKAHRIFRIPPMIKRLLVDREQDKEEALNVHRRYRLGATLAWIGMLAVALFIAPLASTAAAPLRDSSTYGISPPIDPAAPFTPLVKSLVLALTLDEKISLVHGETDPTPLGQAGYLSGVPRLGIPPLRYADADGINVWADTTALPTRLGLGATFDPNAANQAGQLEGTEGLARGVDVIYGPQVDLTRTPDWSRNYTALGEDPFLSGQLGVGEINGIQSQGLMSQFKHFTLYNGQAGGSPFGGGPYTVVDYRTAQELYLEPYGTGVTQGLVSQVMCSYQDFQITSLESSHNFACENAGALNTILRGQWGFKGPVASDYGGTHSVSILQGLDQEFPNADGGFSGTYFGAQLKALVDPISPTYNPTYAAALNQSDARVLYQMQRFGLLKCASPTGPVPNCSLPARPALNKAADGATSEQLAEEAAVLLKNDGNTLPLTQSDLSSGVAVIGPTAALLPASPGGERSRGFGDRNLISPLIALQNLAPGAKITYSPGVDYLGTVVPSSALLTPDGTQHGLLRTQSNSVSTQVDPQLNFTDSNPLSPGITYTWTGTINISATDTYALWLQNSAGITNPANAGYPINPTGAGLGPGVGTSTASLTVDGAPQSLTSPSTIQWNTYPGGNTVNGQYLGFVNGGAYVHLTAGSHTIKITDKVPANAVTPVLFRFMWSPVQASINAAAMAAQKAHTAVVFVDDSNASSPAGGVESLGAYEDQLVQAVATANPNTVVVLNTGDPVLMPWLSNVKSVLEMWYPGQEGGTATANLLLGNANPSGKLPITFPASSNDTPFAGHTDERITGVNGVVTFSEGLDMGYRWYDSQNIQPLFPFGYGLSYTTFSFSHLQTTPVTTDGTEVIRVDFDVTNTGSRAGAEVAQVYLGLPASTNEPPRRLVGFQRVQLNAGQKQHVTVTLEPANHPLATWNTSNQNWAIANGDYTVYLGDSSRPISLTDTLHIHHAG